MDPHEPCRKTVFAQRDDIETLRREVGRLQEEIAHLQQREPVTELASLGQQQEAVMNTCRSLAMALSSSRSHVKQVQQLLQTLSHPDVDWNAGMVFPDGVDGSEIPSHPLFGSTVPLYPDLPGV